MDKLTHIGLDVHKETLIASNRALPTPRIEANATSTASRLSRCRLS